MSPDPKLHCTTLQYKTFHYNYYTCAPAVCPNNCTYIEVRCAQLAHASVDECPCRFPKKPCLQFTILARFFHGLNHNFVQVKPFTRGRRNSERGGVHAPLPRPHACNFVHQLLFLSLEALGLHKPDMTREALNSRGGQGSKHLVKETRAVQTSDLAGVSSHQAEDIYALDRHQLPV